MCMLVHDSGKCHVLCLFYLIIHWLCIDKESEPSYRPPSLIDIDAAEPRSDVDQKPEQETDEQELSTCTFIFLMHIHLIFEFQQNI